MGSGGTLSSDSHDNLQRPYRMHRRSENIDDTRLKIVEATVELHSTVGPSATTVMGIADKAGVTRATVYRHFPDDLSLVNACSMHWLSQQVRPRPDAWVNITGAEDRLRAGLADLYRFYRNGELMLTLIYRDFDYLPVEHQRELQDRADHHRDVLLAAFPERTKGEHRLRAVVGHAVSFETWRSLCIKNELSNKAAIEAMVDLAMNTAKQVKLAQNLKGG
jgi:AcrR family transcriptional regulator